MTNEKSPVDHTDVKIEFADKSTEQRIPKIIVTQYVEPPRDRTIENISIQPISPVRKTSSRKFHKLGISI